MDRFGVLAAEGLGFSGLVNPRPPRHLHPPDLHAQPQENPESVRLLPDGSFRFSPRDLVAYLEGDFAAWCERMHVERSRVGAAGPHEPAWATPDETDEEAALAARKGQDHELNFLGQTRAQEPGLVEITRDDAVDEANTRAAMESGAPIIYQGHLAAGDWHGYPDFLYRCLGNGCPCGGRHYSPWDTKLARSAKPHFLVQLCAYADMLEAVRGYRPGEIVFVLGQGEKRPYRTREFFYYHRQLRRSFSQFQSHWSESHVPDPGLDRGWGRWEAAAERRLAASDHLSRVAGITRGQVRHLEENGVPTLTALARSNGKARPRRISGPVYDRLCAQARLQLASRGRPEPLWEHRPRDPDDLRRGLALHSPRCVEPTRSLNHFRATRLAPRPPRSGVSYDRVAERETGASASGRRRGRGCPSR